MSTPHLVGHFRLHKEAVTLPWNGLDIKRFVGGIPQSDAKLVNRRIYVSVVIDVRIGGPEAHPQFFAGYDFSRLFQQCEKRLIDLALKLQAGPIPRNFLSLLINPEWPKMNVPARREQNGPDRRLIRFTHRHHFRWHRRSPLRYIDAKTFRVFS